MKLSHLTPQLIRLMHKDDKKALGRIAMTPEEAMEGFVAKSEKQLQETICSLLNLRGIWYCRSRMDRRSTVAVGTPDFLCCVHGTALALECKIGKERPTSEQLLTHAAMRRNGWRVEVVRSVQEVKDILDSIPPLT